MVELGCRNLLCQTTQHESVIEGQEIAGTLRCPDRIFVPVSWLDRLLESLPCTARFHLRNCDRADGDVEGHTTLRTV